MFCRVGFFSLCVHERTNPATSQLPDEKEKQMKLESLENLYVDKLKEPCRRRTSF